MSAAVESLPPAEEAVKDLVNGAQAQPETPGFIGVPELELLWVRLDDLVVDEAYQREIDPKQVARIAREFEWEKYYIPRVGTRSNGSYYIIDGQGRIAALRRLVEEGRYPADGLVPVLSVGRTDQRREAELFSGQNDQRGLTSFAEFKSRRCAGEEGALALERVAVAHGLVITERQHSERANSASIGCVVAMDWVRCQHGIETLDKALRVLRTAFPGNGLGVTAPFVKGMGVFLATFPEADIALLAQRMGELTAERLYQEMRRRQAQYAGVGGSQHAQPFRCMAEAIGWAYNYRRRKQIDLTRLMTKRGAR